MHHLSACTVFLYISYTLYLCFQSNWTPLMIATSAGRDDIVKFLVGNGAQINAVNSTGQCPLHYAASKDRYEVRMPYLVVSIKLF